MLGTSASYQCWLCPESAESVRNSHSPQRLARLVGNAFASVSVAWTSEVASVAAIAPAEAVRNCRRDAMGKSLTGRSGTKQVCNNMPASARLWQARLFSAAEQLHLHPGSCAFWSSLRRPDVFFNRLLRVPRYGGDTNRNPLH